TVGAVEQTVARRLESLGESKRCDPRQQRYRRREARTEQRHDEQWNEEADADGKPPAEQQQQTRKVAGRMCERQLVARSVLAQQRIRGDAEQYQWQQPHLDELDVGRIQANTCVAEKVGDEEDVGAGIELVEDVRSRKRQRTPHGAEYPLPVMPRPQSRPLSCGARQ